VRRVNFGARRRAWRRGAGAEVLVLVNRPFASGEICEVVSIRCGPAMRCNDGSRVTSAFRRPAPG
jgi:hypothetical protein